LQPLVFSWRAAQTWRRGTSNAAARRQRAPSPSQNSLAALQVWRHCPQTRHLLGQERRCSVSSQRWSAGVTPPPLIARTNGKRLLLPPGKRSRIVSLFCMSLVIAAHAAIKSPLSAFHQAPKTRHGHTAFHTSRSHRTSHVLFYLHFTHREIATAFAILHNSYLHHIFMFNSLRARVCPHNARGHMCAYIYKICDFTPVF
jgi:hypothetical protein